MIGFNFFHQEAAVPATAKRLSSPYRRPLNIFRRRAGDR